MTPRFRVYHDDTMHEPPHPFMLDDGGAVFRQQDVGPAAPVGPVDADVMLSTSRTDADGAEIWEGDVVKVWGYTSVVEWNQQVSGYVMRLIDQEDTQITKMTRAGIADGNATVIGNVHEHDPEALD